jgi:adenine-specific DNA methylase
MIEEGYDKEYAKVVVSYLGLILNRLISYNNKNCMWVSDGEFVAQIFGRQAIPMVWDYFELYPNSNASGDWNSALEWVILFLDHETFSSGSSKVVQSSATKLPYQDNYFDAVFTDPPYYDNVNYAELSDFFYVWLKRTIGDLYPDLFSTPLVPKSEEIVSNPIRHGSAEKAKQFFENMLTKAFKEIYRVLKPGGIAIIVYAHKTTSGWETTINALLESGLTVTSSWPISTERKSRLTAKETAALQSSIYIVTRKIQKQGIGLYPKVRRELREYLEKKLERLWQEGISGADFFIAAIGAGIEVFGKYEKVIDDEGKEVKADKLLEEIRTITANFAVKQILHDGFTGEVSPLTRFYVLWRWNFGEARVHFDEARKLAQSLGINLEKEWNKGFIRKEKGFIRVLGPKERNMEDLEDSEEMIDVLHYVLLLWEKGDKEKLLKKLSESYGTSEAFYRVVQAITQCLPNESKEKKLLEGCFPSGKKEKLMEEIKSLTSQSKLGRWVR